MGVVYITPLDLLKKYEPHPMKVKLWKVKTAKNGDIQNPLTTFENDSLNEFLDTCSAIHSSAKFPRKSIEVLHTFHMAGSSPKNKINYFYGPIYI